MPNPARFPRIAHFLVPAVSSRIVGVLHEAAGETQGRVEHLRRPTIGFIYADLVRYRMGMLADAMGEDVILLDTRKVPVIYRVGALNLLHYSVHIRNTAYVTNGGKRLVAEYLEAMDQGRLFDPENGPSFRVEGPLAVMATELLVSSVEGTRKVILNHAFVGYPVALSKPGAITAWHEDRLVLTAPAVEEVMPEKHEQLEEIPARLGDVITDEKKARKG